MAEKEDKDTKIPKGAVIPKGTVINWNPEGYSLTEQILMFSDNSRELLDVSSEARQWVREELGL